MNYQWITKKGIPDKSGVYIFRDYKKRPLYIGRATSLKERVRSYFSNDLIATRGPRIVDMVTKAKSLTWQETDSVLEAIILESSLIKKYQPFYNVDERDDKSSLYVVVTEEEWPRVILVRARDFDAHRNADSLSYKVKKRFGPFTDSSLIKEALKILRKMFPFRDAKSVDPRHQSFYESIGRAPSLGVDADNESYIRTINYLILFFEGKSNTLKMRVQKDMKDLAKKRMFESANQCKRLLYALEHINDIALIKRKNENQNGEAENRFRIEAYDVAHIAGTDVVGVMVAMRGGELDKNNYRKFKLSVDRNDDLANLTEIVTRRLNHPEWSYPDIIVVDGNQRQYDIASGILKSRRINIPVVAVTKDSSHKASSFVGDMDLIKKYKDQIVAINMEAHRFSIKYHRNRREKSFGL